MKPLLLIDFDHTLFDTDSFKVEAFTDFDHLPEVNLDQYLYKDAIPFINYVSNHFTPAIFSEGPMPFQQQKIALTKVASLISPQLTFVYSSSQKNKALKPLLQSHHVVALIDDKPEFVDFATNLGLPTIRITRGKYANQPTTTPPTHSVTSLQQIIDQDLLTHLQS